MDLRYSDLCIIIVGPGDDSEETLAGKAGNHGVSSFGMFRPATARPEQKPRSLKRHRSGV